MKKFLTSVANVYAYDDATNALLFYGKTLLDSSIETTLGNTDVRGGRGNQLQYVFYHTAEMNITISDSQWNLDFLSKAVGAGIVTDNNIFYEETVALNGSKVGTVTYTPLALSGAVLYGWVTLSDGSVERVTFSTKTFTASTAEASESVCVRYYREDTAARSVTIDANIIPSIVHLVLEAQLNSSDETTNQIGVVQIDIPKATLTGAFSIKMTPDGVATTPLNARALASDSSSSACDSVPYYATIKEIITAANWYDNVIAIGIEGGDLALTTTNSPYQLRVWAVPSTGLPFLTPLTGTEMTFASSDTGKATVGANTGIVTKVLTGTSTVHAYITQKAAIDASVVVTVS
jgi:hypothetical protein